MPKFIHNFFCDQKAVPLTIQPCLKNVQLSSSLYQVDQQGSLVPRPAAVAASGTSNTAAPTTVTVSTTTSTSPATTSGGGSSSGSVKTVTELYSSDGMSSEWTNTQLSKVKGFRVAQTAVPTSPTLHLQLHGYVRMPLMMEATANHSGVVMLFTSAGRYVMNGTSITPAPKSIQNSTLSQLNLMTVLGYDGEFW